MSDIKFFIPEGHTIPTFLELRVDGIPVTYNRIDGGIEFCVWDGDKDKAVKIVEAIIAKLKFENDDPKHFVSWRTISMDVIDVDERYGCVTIQWKFYVRDSG